MGRSKNFEPDEVIAKAMDAFWSHGYAGTSPAALAEATGVGKGSLYHAFGSKRELFDKALERYDAEGVEAAEQVLSQPGTTEERLRAFLFGMIDHDLARPFPRGCLAVNTAIEFEGQDEAATLAVRRMQEHTIQALKARIEQGRRDGDVDGGTDPEAFAQFLMTTIAGLRVMSKTSDRPTLHRVVDTALAGL